eukprot:2465393-Alexandrium_andersonii.AAC.1
MCSSIAFKWSAAKAPVSRIEARLRGRPRRERGPWTVEGFDKVGRQRAERLNAQRQSNTIGVRDKPPGGALAIFLDFGP